MLPRTMRIAEVNFDVRCQGETLVGGQAPYGMQMIRQYHHRNNIEGMGLPDPANSITQDFNMLSEQRALTIGEIDCLKKRGTGRI